MDTQPPETMTPERWRRIEDIFHAACERTPTGLEAFLSQACAGDADLRHEVESLLARNDSRTEMIERPAAEANIAAEPSVGSLFGPYRVEASIGKGGMGEVWKAHDPRLNRDVAIKISAQEFSGRFEREARAIAALNHPNICTLYDIGPNYLVMEYIKGTPLRGPLPVEQALKYAEQICDALDAAHRSGVVHRDLKPANILLSKQGIKLLDFGLAQMQSSPNDPTMTQLTQAGAVMGTPAYMSPEQWEGKPVDARSDIYSLGCVLYEMLSGKRVSPDRAPLAGRLETVLQTCLERDPEERWQSTRELKHALRWAAQEKPEESGNKTRHLPLYLRRPVMLTTAMVLALTLIAAGVSYLRLREKGAEAPVLRVSIVAPERTHFLAGNWTPPAISPDGKRVIFQAVSDDGKNQFWLRALDSLPARELPGTEGASYPFWSADSRWIGFFAGGKLKKMDVLSGPATDLADATTPRGGSWSKDGAIIFAPTPYSGLQQVAASGGPPRPATPPDPKNPRRFPFFLPDGRHFLYMSGSSGGDYTIRIGSLDSPQDDRPLPGKVDSFAAYAQGQLLLVQGNTLIARPFDPRLLSFSGEPVAVADQVQVVGSTLGLAGFSVSGNGVLVYQSSSSNVFLILFDRTGKRLGTVGQAGALTQPSFSGDRKTVAATAHDLETARNDIWLYDVARGLRTRFTFGPMSNNSAVWSPDGRTILFRSNRSGRIDLFRKSADGSGGEELLYADNLAKTPNSISPDGRNLAFTTVDPKTGDDIWILPDPLAQERKSKPYPLVQTPFNEQNPQFSPDGRWIAYQSNESGKYEIYVAPFPGPGARRQISATGGIAPRWRGDGSELFYVAPDGRMTAAELEMKGGTFEVKKIGALFGPVRTGYDVTSDGQKFLVLAQPEGETGGPLTLVQNWGAGLKK